MGLGCRPKDPVWEHFHEVLVGTKIYEKCKSCGFQLSSKASRMKENLARCSSRTVPSQETPTTRPSQKRFIEEVEVSSEETEQAPPMKRGFTQPKMDIHVVKTDNAAKEFIDETIAKFIYECNIPFSVVEHPLFYGESTQTWIYASVSGKHLDAVCHDLKGQMKEELNGKVVTLVKDGWSNIHNEPVVACCIQTENKSYLLDAKDTGTMTKSAVNCKALCQETIKKAELDFNCTVRNVVTDNAKHMEKIRQGLQEDDPKLNVYGCSAHWLNLLGQDITPSALMKHIVEINKYFRNHHKPASWLKEFSESVKSQLPGDMRWNSQLTCLDTFIRNRASLVQIVQDHDVPNDQDVPI